MWWNLSSLAQSHLGLSTLSLLSTLWILSSGVIASLQFSTNRRFKTERDIVAHTFTYYICCASIFLSLIYKDLIPKSGHILSHPSSAISFSLCRQSPVAYNVPSSSSLNFDSFFKPRFHFHLSKTFSSHLCYHWASSYLLLMRLTAGIISMALKVHSFAQLFLHIVPHLAWL